MKRLGAAGLIFAAVSLCGGHWAVLQGVAWARMLVEYSPEAGFVQAVRKTFSGTAPCGLCKKIAAAKSQDKTPAGAPSTLRKTEVARPFTAEIVPVPMASGFRYPRVEDIPALSRSDEPPFPVPRSV